MDMRTKYKFRLCLSYCTVGSKLYTVILVEVFKKLNHSWPAKLANTKYNYDTLCWQGVPGSVVTVQPLGEAVWNYWS